MKTLHIALPLIALLSFSLAAFAQGPGGGSGTGGGPSLDAAAIPLLLALKNGALIEELDMHDIIYCPEVIVDAVDDIIDEYECGMEYTDEKILIRSYGNLLEGSKNHLRAFVRQIEANFPEEGTYVAQYLSQEEVNEILGR
jgi:hypothetical protein